MTRSVVRAYVKNNPNDLYILVKKASDDPANWPWSLREFILAPSPKGKTPNNSFNCWAVRWGESDCSESEELPSAKGAFPAGLGLSPAQTVVVGTRAKEFLCNEKSDVRTQAQLLERVRKRAVKVRTPRRQRPLALSQKTERVCRSSEFLPPRDTLSRRIPTGRRCLCICWSSSPSRSKKRKRATFCRGRRR